MFPFNETTMYYENICLECDKELPLGVEDYCSQHCYEASMR